jgi:radical SAM superfamily enzyme YgiQ (UPF0313 family)
MPTGFSVVLTADRTLMAGHRLLLDGMVAASQTTVAPPLLTGPLLTPAADAVAPLGLRRIEAALRAGGFGNTEIAVAPPHRIDAAIGPATRVVAISTGDPLGRGMNSTTMTAIAGGRSYPEALFQQLVSRARKAIAVAGSRAKLLIGGPGAWQLARDAGSRRSLGIDHVVTGYAEGNATEIFRALVNGQSLPEVIEGRGLPAAKIPPIRGPSTMGVVEISRGCGWGCDFCTIAGTAMEHLHEETILADAHTNLAAGQSSFAVLSEDFFRYGGAGQKANPPALLGLLKKLRALDGVRLIQADHANVTSIAQFSDTDLRTVRDLLVGNTNARFPWLNVGVETLDAKLLSRNGGRPKMGGCLATEWPSFCAVQVERLIQAGFLPMVSLVVGLPGETETTVHQALQWVDAFREKPVTIFPLLYAPVDGSSPAGRHDLTHRHWQLFEVCYRLNFRWIPRMYRDNQQAAGIPAGKQFLVHYLGYGQILQWKFLFKWHAWRAGR